MKHFLTIVGLAMLMSIGVIAQTPPAPPSPSNVAGKWSMTLEMSMGVATPTLTFVQDGEKLSGTYTSRYGEFPLTGTVKQRAIQFSLTMKAGDVPVEMSFTGEVAADAQSMKGTATLGDMGKATWNAKRN